MPRARTPAPCRKPRPTPPERISRFPSKSGARCAAFLLRRRRSPPISSAEKTLEHAFMKIDLTGKTALVTGSTAGIGHAIAKGLAGAGASVVVNGRTQGKVDPAVAAIVKAVPGARIRGVAADVSTAAGCATLAAA